MSESSGTANDLFLWQTNRRKLIKAGIIAGTLSQLTFLESCASNKITEEENPHFNYEQTRTLKSVMEILFPNDGNGPGIEELHSFKYILWVMDDKGAYEKHKVSLTDGVQWLINETKKKDLKFFFDLEKSEQEKIVAEIVLTETGKNLCSVILTYILESLLLDPVYGINTNNVGWNWLSHTPGFPQPTEELKYENILDTVRKSYNTVS